jgi:hypothetical protein
MLRIQLSHFNNNNNNNNNNLKLWDFNPLDTQFHTIFTNIHFYTNGRTEDDRNDETCCHRKIRPININLNKGPRHCSGGYSPASHRGGPGSIPGRSMWDLWWTKWHWDRFLSEYFGFPLSISFHRFSIKWKSRKKPSPSSSQDCTISLKAAVRP